MEIPNFNKKISTLILAGNIMLKIKTILTTLTALTLLLPTN